MHASSLSTVPSSISRAFCFIYICLVAILLGCGSSPKSQQHNDDSKLALSLSGADQMVVSRKPSSGQNEAEVNSVSLCQDSGSPVSSQQRQAADSVSPASGISSTLTKLPDVVVIEPGDSIDRASFRDTVPTLVGKYKRGIYKRTPPANGQGPTGNFEFDGLNVVFCHDEVVDIWLELDKTKAKKISVNNVSIDKNSPLSKMISAFGPCTPIVQVGMTAYDCRRGELELYLAQSSTNRDVSRVNQIRIGSIESQSCPHKLN